MNSLQYPWLRPGIVKLTPRFRANIESVGVAFSVQGGVSNMDNQVSVPTGATSGEGFESLANLNSGFLGTGYTTTVELSFVAMALIILYIAFGMARYYIEGTELELKILRAVGLYEDPESMGRRG